MKVAAIGTLLAAGLFVVVAVFGMRAEVQAQPRLDSMTPSDQIIAFSSESGQGSQQITLIDPKTRVLGVYHVDRSSGAVTLKSIRNIHWDLQMDEFNGVSPSPREIRQLLDQR